MYAQTEVQNVWLNDNRYKSHGNSKTLDHHAWIAKGCIGISFLVMKNAGYVFNFIESVNFIFQLRNCNASLFSSAGKIKKSKEGHKDFHFSLFPFLLHEGPILHAIYFMAALTWKI